MKSIVLILLLSSLVLTGCGEKKDLGEIIVSGNATKKRQLKTHEQFIQIAYIDLFNKTISPQRLSSAKQIFDSQGDDDISCRLYIRQLLKEATDQIPAANIVKQDPEKFVEQSYLKFMGRYPNGYEKKLLEDDIKADTSASAAKIYYILMTTQEYRTF